MRQGSKLVLFSLLALVMSALYTNCGAKYGISGQDSSSSEKGQAPTDLQGELVTNTDAEPAPPDVNPDEPGPPSVDQCKYKILLQVTSLSVKEKTGPSREVLSSPAEVDLCALAHDFHGTIENQLKPQGLSGVVYSQVRILLAETGHRVISTDTNEVVCQLRVPPGNSAGMHFMAKPDLLTYDPAKKVEFNYSAEEAFHILGNGMCQLFYPVGNYWLEQTGP